MENRDAATVRALELAVARAEAATAGRAEAEAALAEVEARAFDVQRATRNLEKDVERLTGERDAATAARAAAEERLQAATPSKKDHAPRAPGVGAVGTAGVRSELDNSQAARAAALRELQRGIRRVRASRFWFQDDPASLVFRDVAAALGAVGCPAEEPCRTFDEGDDGFVCTAVRDARRRPWTARGRRGSYLRDRAIKSPAFVGAEPRLPPPSHTHIGGASRAPAASIFGRSAADVFVDMRRRLIMRAAPPRRTRLGDNQVSRGVNPATVSRALRGPHTAYLRLQHDVVSGGMAARVAQARASPACASRCH